MISAWSGSTPRNAAAGLLIALLALSIMLLRPCLRRLRFAGAWHVRDRGGRTAGFGDRVREAAYRGEIRGLLRERRTELGCGSDRLAARARARRDARAGPNCAAVPRCGALSCAVGERFGTAASRSYFLHPLGAHPALRFRIADFAAGRACALRDAASFTSR